MTENTKPAEPAEPDKDSNENTQSILDFGSALTRTPHGTVYCLTIIGQIEGHSVAGNTAKTTKYEHVLPLLAKLPLDPKFMEACDYGTLPQDIDNFPQFNDIVK